MAALEAISLYYQYEQRQKEKKYALKDINLTINEGEVVGVIGRTGSGKSTLFKLLSGLLKPTRGQMLLGGEAVCLKAKKQQFMGTKIGMVWQYPEDQLFAETVYQDIAFGPQNCGFSAPEIRERVYEALEFVSLAQAILDRSPFDLSGGEKRRVAIAGIIAMQPEILILDEPTAGLDPNCCQQLLANLQDYHQKTNATLIMASHSMENIAQFAPRLLLMSAGELLLDGAASEIFSRGDELLQQGLEIPLVCQVMRELRELGLTLDTSVFSVDQAVKVLMDLRGKAHV